MYLYINIEFNLNRKIYKETPPLVYMNPNLEEFTLMMKDFLYHLDKMVQTQSRQTSFIEDSIKNGYIFEKEVCKFGKTSAAIFLPKRYIGRKFRVVLIPLQDEDFKRLKMPRKAGRRRPEELATCSPVVVARQAERNKTGAVETVSRPLVGLNGNE